MCQSETGVMQATYVPHANAVLGCAPLSRVDDALTADEAVGKVLAAAWLDQRRVWLPLGILLQRAGSHY
jgi:hypothetical protein